MSKPIFVLSNDFLTSLNAIRNHPEGAAFVENLSRSTQSPHNIFQPQLTVICTMNKSDTPKGVLEQQRKDFERLPFLQIMYKDKRVCMGTYEHQPRDNDVEIRKKQDEQVTKFQEFFPSYLKFSDHSENNSIQLDPLLEKFAADYYHQGGYSEDAENILLNGFFPAYSQANNFIGPSILRLLDRETDRFVRYAYFNIIDLKTIDYSQVSVINGIEDGDGNKTKCKFCIESKSKLSLQPDLKNPRKFKPHVSLEQYSLRFETEQDKEAFFSLFGINPIVKDEEHPVSLFGRIRAYVKRFFDFIMRLFNKENFENGIAQNFITHDYEKSLFNVKNSLKEDKTVGLSQEYLHAKALYKYFNQDLLKESSQDQSLPAWPQPIQQETRSLKDNIESSQKDEKQHIEQAVQVLTALQESDAPLASDNASPPAIVVSSQQAHVASHAQTLSTDLRTPTETASGHHEIITRPLPREDLHAFAVHHILEQAKRKEQETQAQPKSSPDSLFNSYSVVPMFNPYGLLGLNYLDKLIGDTMSQFSPFSMAHGLPQEEYKKVIEHFSKKTPTSLSKTSK